VFPFQSRATCHYSVRDAVTDAADAAIRDQPRATLEYSYYREGADADAIPGVFELWSKNAVRREPMLETVRKAGSDLGVNGVLMVWYICSRNQNVAVDTYEVEVYLIDVNRDQAFHSKMNFLDAGRAISTVFDQFLTAYGFAGGGKYGKSGVPEGARLCSGASSNRSLETPESSSRKGAGPLTQRGHRSIHRDPRS
jgi:hypothetical protein